MPRLLRPRRLPRGGTIGLAAPSGPVDPERLAEGEARLRAAGFRVRRRRDLVARRGYLAGDDRRRAAELEQLVRDPGVDAILCVRGGYGAQRIVERLSPELFRGARKPLVGYSDATTLLLWQRRRAGLVGFHGPMLERGASLSDAELDALLRVLCGEERHPQVWRGQAGGGGRAEGRLIGGSLTLVAASLGTPWEVETRGAILMLEEVGEKPYRIDRLLGQLRAAGKLDAAAGVGIGALVGCDAAAEPSAQAVVAECLRPLRIPWVSGLPFGHDTPNLPWPVGARAAVDGRRRALHILEAGVAER